MKDRLFVLTSLGRLILRERAWWMVPIAVALGLVGILMIIVAVTPAAPFLYPLF
jgi:hypothetical protein